MAATRISLRKLLVYFTVFYHVSHNGASPKASEGDLKQPHHRNWNFIDLLEPYEAWHSRPAPVNFNLTPSGFSASKFPAIKWTRRGQTTLLIPGHDPPTDITIYMDVLPNPGPAILYPGRRPETTTAIMLIPRTEKLCYSRNELLDLRRCVTIPPQDRTRLFAELKLHGLLRFRSRRGGKCKIPTILSHRSNIHCLARPTQGYANTANLIRITCLPLDRVVTSKTVDICLLNARSISNKLFIIKDFVIDNNVDVLALTETWLCADIADQKIINDLCPAGYLFQHVPRGTRGGGVAVLYKQCLRFKNKSSTSKVYKSFELADYSMKYSSHNLRMVVVYRPPPSTKNGFTLEHVLQ